MSITDAEIARINRTLSAAQSDWTAFPAPGGGVRIMAPVNEHVADFPAGTPVEALLVAELAAELAARRAWIEGFKAGRADGLNDAALQKN